jgi:hypothetical protein
MLNRDFRPCQSTIPRRTPEFFSLRRDDPGDAKRRFMAPLRNGHWRKPRGLGSVRTKASADGAVAAIPGVPNLRLKPPVSAHEAHQYLSLNATLVWGVDHAAKIDGHLKSIADAMAVVSALDIPEAVEPLFGEDIGLDPELDA